MRKKVVKNNIMMDELCSACLCSGRKMTFVRESSVYSFFKQIVNGISVPEEMHNLAQICWECSTLLKKFQAFQQQARSCFEELAVCYQVDPIVKSHLSKTPRLQSHQALSISILINARNEIEDNIKAELSDTHFEDTFVDNLSDYCPEKKEKEPKKAKKKVKLKKTKRKKTTNLVSETVEDKPVVNGETKPEFKCDKCARIFYTESEMVGHIDEEHAEKPVAVARQAKGRSAEPLPERPQCVECGKLFSSRKTYRYHLNVLHKGQNRYPCPRCGKVYQWKSNLGRHLRSHKARESGELHCEKCDKSFASVATYRQHIRISRRHVSESEFTFTCEECGKKFVNKTRLQDHIDWEHLNKIKFRCQTCNKPFKCHTSLYVHLQNVHRNKDKKDNLCHVCGKSYQNAAKLKYHIVAMHTTETPYQCRQCDAAFGWYSSLYRHVREVHYKMKVQPKKNKKTKKAQLEELSLQLAPGPEHLGT